MVFVLIWLVSILISLAARHRTAACSNTLNQGLEKIQAVREYDYAPDLALSPTWETEFLAPSVARSTADAFNIVCLLDHDGKLMSPHKTRSKNVPTKLLRDRQHTQDFAGPISLRASEVLGSISRNHMKLASRASRPGLTDGCASFATGCARLTDFTLKVMNKCVVLDFRMNPTPSPTTTNALFCMVCLFLSGDWLLCFHGEVIFSMT